MHMLLCACLALSWIFKASCCPHVDGAQNFMCDFESPVFSCTYPPFFLLFLFLPMCVFSLLPLVFFFFSQWGSQPQWISQLTTKGKNNHKHNTHNWQCPLYYCVKLQHEKGANEYIWRWNNLTSKHPNKDTRRDQHEIIEQPKIDDGLKMLQIKSFTIKQHLKRPFWHHNQGSASRNVS